MTALELGHTWIDCALAQIANPERKSSIRAVLQAFAGPFPRGGPPPPPEMPWPGDFSALMHLTRGHYGPAQIVQALAQEVDRGQAELFVRRLNSVVALLETLAQPGHEAQLMHVAHALLVGLWHRAHQISQTTTPKALRIRALADFYYSQAVTLVHAEAIEHAPAMTQILDNLPYRNVAPGIEHAHYSGPCPVGPINFNLLKINIDRVDITATNCRDQLKCELPFTEWATPLCDAAVSGGFFLYSESDISAPSERRDPVGLLVCAGKVHNPPTFARAAIVQDKRGNLDIRRVGPSAGHWSHQGRTLPIQSFLNRASTLTGPDAASIAVVGQQVVASGQQLEVPLNGMVLVLNDNAPLPAVGDKLEWHSPFEQAMAGGPLLINQSQPCLDLRSEDFWGTAPPVTFSQDETGDTNLLARLAVGITPDNTLYALAVDGRNFEHSLGMTLHGMGEIMLALGCDRAANMDGGSSKRMLVQGETVDLHSTEIIAKGGKREKQRPVHSALLFKSRG